MDNFKEKYIDPFEGVEYVYEPAKGFIVWRRGTGDNVELLHLRAFELQKGHATWLFKKMLSRVNTFNSVFVFFRTENTAAKAAYRSFGFTVQEIPPIYRDGGTSIGVGEYDHLCKTMGI